MLTLAMTWAGAGSETADEMASTLAIDLEQGAQHDAMKAQAASLKRDADALVVRVANRLWPARDAKLTDAYASVIEEHYGAKPEALDYAGDPEAARQRINGWVSESTEEKIPELIPAGILDGATKLVLTNAIYFKGKWAKGFDEGRTVKQAFAAQSGPVQADMMLSSPSQRRHAQTPTYELLSLEYADGAEMLVILPKEGSFDAVAKELGTPEGLNAALESRLSPQKLAVAFPRFEFRAKAMLKKHLRALGMKRAFEGGADFEGMFGDREPLSIDEVIHEGYVSVDEEGTEAAAATAVVMARGAKAGLSVRVDRPFFFVIRETATNTPLFVGRVMDPTR